MTIGFHPDLANADILQIAFSDSQSLLRVSYHCIATNTSVRRLTTLSYLRPA